jgi:hypothetical protein
MNAKARKNEKNMQRVTRIALDHILYSNRYPDRLKEIGMRLGITPESALAYAIADQVCEEFEMTLRH